MDTEEIMDTVNLLELLWNQGLFYQFTYEMKELFETKKESYVHAIMVLFKQRIEKK